MMEDSKRSVWQLLRGCHDLPASDRRQLNQFVGWLAAWALAFLGATFLLRSGRWPAGTLSIVLALAPSLLAIAAILAYVRFLRRADELYRKIQLEALALGFGAGFVTMFALRLLELAGAPRADIVDPMAAMVIFWVLGQWLGARRYA